MTSPTDPTADIATAPEAVRALAYLRRHGTESTHARLRERFTRTLDTITATLDEVDEVTARTPPPNGGWCVQEIVDHLAVTNEAALAELTALVAGHSPIDGPVPAGLQSDTPMASSWSSVRARRLAADAALLAAVDRATDATPLTARAPLVMVVKGRDSRGEPCVLEWLEPLDWKAYVAAFRAHGLEHVAQIERVLASIADRRR